MSQVLKTVDVKSFIIGVLSTIVVCMAMGAKMSSTTWIVRKTTGKISMPGMNEQPFAVEHGAIYYRRPM